MVGPQVIDHRRHNVGADIGPSAKINATHPVEIAAGGIKKAATVEQIKHHRDAAAKLARIGSGRASPAPGFPARPQAFLINDAEGCFRVHGQIIPDPTGHDPAGLDPIPAKGRSVL